MIRDIEHRKNLLKDGAIVFEEYLQQLQVRCVEEQNAGIKIALFESLIAVQALYIQSLRTSLEEILQQYQKSQQERE